MSVSFLADVHISPLTVDELKHAGYKIDRLTHFLPANASDERIIALAQKKKLVIITQDLDFSSLIAQSGKSTPSVISMRVGNVDPKAISELLFKIIPAIVDELNAGAIVSVDDLGFRIRKLPVHS